VSSKTMWTLLIVAAFVIGAYFLYQWWKKYQAQNGGSFSLGTNLNSVAPELIGGSSGPQVQPAVSLPVNITLTETTSSPQPPAENMVPMNNTTPDALSMANPATGSGSTMPEDSSQQAPLVNTDVSYGTGPAPTPPVPPDKTPTKKKDDDDDKKRRR
jgi:hypothetical protein